MRPPLGEFDGVRRGRDRLAVWINKASLGPESNVILATRTIWGCGNEGLRERYSTQETREMRNRRWVHDFWHTGEDRSQDAKMKAFGEADHDLVHTVHKYNLVFKYHI